jgi:hypothetical protein
MSVGSGGVYEGTTPTPLNGNTAFTVYALDSIGQIASAEAAPITNVKPYSAPYVTIENCYRCSAQGAPQDGGPRYMIRATAHYSSVDSKNGVSVFLVKADGTNTWNPLSSGALMGPYEGTPDANEVYTLTVRLTDTVGTSVDTAVSLAAALRDFVMKRGSGGAHLGIGMTPQVSAYSGRSTIQLPPNGKILVGGVDLIAWLETNVGDFPGWSS